MRHTWSSVAAALGVAGSLVLGACATSPRAAAPNAQVVAQNKVQVRVQNNLVPSTGVTVWVVPETGAKQLLGNLNPSASGTFSFPATNTAQFVLVARTTGGMEIRSRAFSIASGSDVVTWDMYSNSVSVAS
jgi:hypothetical protein